MRIASRRPQRAVTEQYLDRADVGAGLEQMGRKAVTKHMRVHTLANPGYLGGLFQCTTHRLWTNAATL